jgi:hypothetical protein
MYKYYRFYSLEVTLLIEYVLVKIMDIKYVHRDK